MSHYHPLPSFSAPYSKAGEGPPNILYAKKFLESQEILASSLLEGLQSTWPQLIYQELSNDGYLEDMTSRLLPDVLAEAILITKSPMMLAGVDTAFLIQSMVEQTMPQGAFKPSFEITLEAEEGQFLAPGSVFARLKGPARVLTAIERSLLNFIQTLSGTATTTSMVVDWLQGSPTQLLDTRKTLPALRFLQKYAVCVGGGRSHRLGLFDAFLIKENHIEACGGVPQALDQAVSIRAKLPDCPWIEIEIETLSQLQQALTHPLFASKKETNSQGIKASQGLEDRILLDNVDEAFIQAALNWREKLSPGVPFELSGVAFDKQVIQRLGGWGLDYMSLGSLTKHVQAADLSMRLYAG